MPAVMLEMSGMLDRLARRDRATARHCAAVARYSRELCRAAGASEPEQELVHRAGLLHDVGKTDFPDHILEGKQRLTPADWETIQEHPERGAQLVRSMLGFEDVAEIILCHHERPDGRGYPRGLPARRIPRLSRMVSIADTFDVMTARDSYRSTRTQEAAVAELHRVAGSQLDRALVRVFVMMLERQQLAFVPRDYDARMELRSVTLPAASWTPEPAWAQVATAS